jgi:hypothetical protein
MAELISEFQYMNAYPLDPRPSLPYTRAAAALQAMLQSWRLHLCRKIFRRLGILLNTETF